MSLLLLPLVDLVQVYTNLIGAAILYSAHVMADHLARSELMGAKAPVGLLTRHVSKLKALDGVHGSKFFSPCHGYIWF